MGNWTPLLLEASHIETHWNKKNKIRNALVIYLWNVQGFINSICANVDFKQTMYLHNMKENIPQNNLSLTLPHSHTHTYACMYV